MNKYLKIFSPLVFLFSLILILCFKSVPSGKLWKNYSVIYVPLETEESLVSSVFDELKIKNVIRLSSQYLPLLVSENSIEVSMLRLNYNSKDFAYTSKRNALFFDKANKWRLYYIPNEFKSEISQICEKIESSGIPCGSDNAASFPYLLIVVELLVCGMLFVFVKNKIPFLAGAFLPLVFLYSNPFYPIAMATCLVLLCLFFVCNVWKRSGALKLLVSRRIVPLMLLVSFISAFAGSVASGFWFVLAAAGTAGALYSVYIAENWWRGKKMFEPVLIRPAKRVSLFAGKAFTTLGIVCGGAILLFALFFLTSSNTINARTAKLLLPSNTSFQDSSLPSMNEYYRWAWNVKTYPYKSLNKNAASLAVNAEDSEQNAANTAGSKNSEVVEFDDFVEDAATGIIGVNRKIMRFDDSFKKDIFDGIDSLQFDSAEKLMKSENSNFTGGYSAVNSYQINFFGIIMMFICLFILLFIYFSIIIRKGFNK